MSLVKNRVFAAALIAAAFLIFGARPASAAPALWLVQSPAGKVYLFGTIHLMRSDTPWRYPELEAAIAQSQDLYLEIGDLDNLKAAASSVFKIGMDRDHPLSTQIPKSDVALLDAEAKRFGLPGEAMFEPMRPWLAYMVLSVFPAMHSGYGSASGVDLQIRKEFAAAGKPVRGFETFDMQSHIFADLPEAVQVALLETQLKTMNKQSAAGGLDALVNAWESGDEAQLESATELDKMAKSPLYAPLLANRNKAWANALAERLKQPGTSFVAVGAAHLLGPDGVPALLQHMGFTVSRVQASAVLPESPAPSASAPPSPTPSAPPTPVPRTVTPPLGWHSRQVPASAGTFAVDMVCVDPNHPAAVMAGHLDVPAGSIPDLDSLDTFFHQGLVAAAGGKGVAPSRRVKICSGKQDGTYATLTIGRVQEDIVLALSDRAYVAEYVRPHGLKDDPAAIRSLLSLCAP